MAGLRSAEDKFPDNVDYDTSCGALCLTHASAAAIVCYGRLMTALTLCVQRSNKVATQAGAQSPLFMFELAMHRLGDADDEAPIENQVFAVLSSAQGRSGRFAAKQIWTLCSLLDDQPANDPFEDVHLHCVRRDFVPHHAKLSHPLRNHQHGMLRQSS